MQKIDLGLTGYDELFANDEERKVNKLPRIFDIPISEIDDFPDHPFKVKIDEDICEVCGKTEILTPQEAFDLGWDYPPMMGRFGVLSPRTCPNCNMMDTVWAEVTLMGKKPEDLTKKQQKTILRIIAEPDSILVKGE